jgi:hypothetical protein
LVINPADADMNLAIGGAVTALQPITGTVRTDACLLGELLHAARAPIELEIGMLLHPLDLLARHLYGAPVLKASICMHMPLGTAPSNP